MTKSYHSPTERKAFRRPFLPAWQRVSMSGQTAFFKPEKRRGFLEPTTTFPPGPSFFSTVSPRRPRWNGPPHRAVTGRSRYKYPAEMFFWKTKEGILLMRAMLLVRALGFCEDWTC